MGVDIPDGAMDQAKPMMDMIDAMGQQMFNEIIDENGDGAASLEEIEMVTYYNWFFAGSNAGQTVSIQSIIDKMVYS